MNSFSTLVLVPGTLCDEALFADLAGLLADDIEILVADVTQSSSIESLADDVLAQAPDRFAIAGLSLGGIIAMQVAHRAPDRVAGLGLLDTNLDAASPDQVVQRTRWMRDVRAGHFARLVSDHLVQPLTAEPDRFGPEIFDMAIRVGPAAFLRQNQANIDRPDQRALIEDVSVPVLIANGEHDVVCPTHLHADLVQRSSTATHVVIPGAGHLATLEQPAESAYAIRGWLQTCNNNKHLQEGNTHEYNVA